MRLFRDTESGAIITESALKAEFDGLKPETDFWKRCKP